MFGTLKKNFSRFVSRLILSGLFLFALFLLFTGAITASTTNGTIDSTSKYAWSNNAGWINFGAANGNINITDSGLTGYAWNEIYGWINMAPSNSGVTINASGALSGSAFGENAGWINFSGVSISCSGYFTGNATGDTVGTITFTCTNCSVGTDYKPQNCRGGGSSSGGSSSGGGEIFCGDSSCNGTETCGSCSADCGACPAFCGDSSCNGNETCGSCETDCGACPVIPPAPSCGNGICDEGEACDTCSVDCGICPGGSAPPSCGNETCDSNEKCDTCPTDCGACPLPFFTLKCGDEICSATETCYTCSADCGQCQLIPTPIPGVAIPPIIPPAIREVIKSPIGSATTKAITTTGIITTVAVTAFSFPFSLLELFSLPLRLIGILLTAFGLKKRYPPWGVAYDSATKQPLDPAYITLMDSSGKEISSAITDLDGRYGFLAEPGFYGISANKTNYIFPSQKLADKKNDEVYDNLYFGEPIEVKKGQAIIKNIPLDPIAFDWNEFAKKDKQLTKFYSQWDAIFRKISNFIYYAGFIAAVIAFFAAPYPYNLIIIGLYVFLLVLRILGVKPRPFGSVSRAEDSMPMQFAIIRIISQDSSKEISHRITDKYGRYFCLVPKGRYYVKIEKKNNDGSYSLVYMSEAINASKNGIIKKRFRVNF